MSFGDLLYAFVNTAGIGGVMVISVITIALVVYYFLTRWVIEGGQAESEDGRQRRRRIK